MVIHKVNYHSHVYDEIYFCFKVTISSGQHSFKSWKRMKIIFVDIPSTLLDHSITSIKRNVPYLVFVSSVFIPFNITSLSINQSIIINIIFL